MFQANSLGSMRQSRMWVNEASDGPIPTLLLPRSPILSCTASCQDFSLKIQHSKATFEEGERHLFSWPLASRDCLIAPVKKLPAMQETGFSSCVGKIPWRREWQPTPVFLPGESHGQRTWQAKVPGVAKSRTRLSN